jgi:hypothetical protein
MVLLKFLSLRYDSELIYVQHKLGLCRNYTQVQKNASGALRLFDRAA